MKPVTVEQIKEKWNRIKLNFYPEIKPAPDWGWKNSQKNKKFKEFLRERLFWFPKVSCEIFEDEEKREIIHTKVTVESYATVTLVAVSSLDSRYYVPYYRSEYITSCKTKASELTPKQLALIDVIGQVLAMS